MINQWTLGNFKSVYSKTSLEFTPLTLFVGSNSAGKSTFIQSMLIVAQTLQDQITSRHVVLNGRMIRAGSFSSVVSSGSGSRDIQIGFRLAPTDVLSSIPFNVVGVTDYWPLARDLSIDCDFTFTSAAELPGDPRDLHTLIRECRVKYRDKETSTASEIHVRRRASSERQSGLDALLHGIEPIHSKSREYSADYDVLAPRTIQSIESSQWEYTPAEGSIVGATLSHFVPSALVVDFDANRDAAQKAVRQLLSGRASRITSDLEEDLSESLEANRDGLLNAVQSILVDSGRAKDSHNPLTQRRLSSDIYQARQDPSAAALRKLVASISRTPEGRAVLNAFESELVGHIERRRGPRRTTGYIPVAAVQHEALRRAFTESFRYLGPLRDEPKVVYPFEGFVEAGSVGLKGEYTAAALEFYRNLPVGYVEPTAGRMGGDVGIVRSETLERAVSNWLQYLGVVHSVRSEDKGVFGHELSVSVREGEPYHTLPHVGVGVSQVLPILVMSLLSNPGATLIFEQPELHLHPAVQARLADFFLSMASSGRQCIVETHSEYLISRLRLRSAQARGDSISRIVQMYFVEKRGVQSTYVPGKITPTGSMSDWPAGFFDQGAAESREILGAAMQKRRDLGH